MTACGLNVNDVEPELTGWNIVSTSWCLRHMGINESTSILSPLELASQINEKNEPYSRKYMDKVSTFIKDNGFVSSNSINYMKEESSDVVSVLDLPVSKRTPRGLLVKSHARRIQIISIATDVIFNTLRLDEYQRASKIVGQFLLPYGRSLFKAMRDTDIELFSVGACFASRNFLKEDDAPSGEMVVMTFTKQSMEQFAEGKITDQELVNSSAFYMTKDSHMNKIQITLKN